MNRVLLTTAPDQLVAEMWCELLRGEDVPAVIRPSDAMSSYMGVTVYPCRIMVWQDHLPRAREILGAHLGHEVE